MNKLTEVKIDTVKNIRDYRQFTPAIVNSCLKMGREIKGATVIHISATPKGGGIAEMLHSQVPLERSLGINSHWLAIRAPHYFFKVTKKIHNLFQGKAGNLTENEKGIYLSVSRELGLSLKRLTKNISSAVIIVHDPQPLSVVPFIPERFKTILRIHVDLSMPNDQILEFLRPNISRYQNIILSSKEYAPAFRWLPKSKLRFIMPAIDPLAEKNLPMSQLAAQELLLQFNIDCTRPTISQVSRFDPWKDPIGVIKAYYVARNEIPDLQLVMVGFFLAVDDPESISVFKKVKRYAKGDRSIHLLSNPKLLKNVSNDHFINALYTASTVVIQKSIREGFGLTVTEAMWKGKPVVAGITPGTLLQIKNNKNGLLISSPEEAGAAIAKLVKNPKLREKLGKAAHQSVKKKFLLPRYLKDNLKIYKSLLKQK